MRATPGLTGLDRQMPDEQECVLLLGPKHKIDNYLPCMQLLGSTPAGLLGVRYVSAHFNVTDLPGSLADRPFIYTCSDADVAFDLIRDPPEHVTQWMVIVDGARLGRALHASLATASELAQTRLIVLAELREREATAALMTQGPINVWYLEDQDVEVPPISARRLSPELDRLSRFLGRQANHWSTARSFIDSEDAFLDAVAGCFRDRGSRNDPGAGLLDFSLSAFVQKAIARPLSDPDSAPELRQLARSLASQASVLRLYDPSANRLFELFTSFCGWRLLHPRQE